MSSQGSSLTLNWCDLKIILIGGTTLTQRLRTRPLSRCRPSSTKGTYPPGLPFFVDSRRSFRPTYSRGLESWSNTESSDPRGQTCINWRLRLGSDVTCLVLPGPLERRDVEPKRSPRRRPKVALAPLSQYPDRRPKYLDSVPMSERE